MSDYQAAKILCCLNERHILPINTRVCIKYEVIFPDGTKAPNIWFYGNIINYDKTSKYYKIQFDSKEITYNLLRNEYNGINFYLI